MKKIIFCTLSLIAINLSAMRTPMKLNASLVARKNYTLQPQRQISLKSAVNISLGAAICAGCGYLGARYGVDFLVYDLGFKTDAQVDQLHKNALKIAGVSSLLPAYLTYRKTPEYNFKKAQVILNDLKKLNLKYLENFDQQRLFAHIDDSFLNQAFPRAHFFNEIVKYSAQAEQAQAIYCKALIDGVDMKLARKTNEDLTEIYKIQNILRHLMRMIKSDPDLIRQATGWELQKLKKDVQEVKGNVETAQIQSTVATVMAASAMVNNAGK
jgi:hypothetical protein